MQFFYNKVTELFNVYLLKFKSESLQNFKHYTALWENQTNCYLKIIHTDSDFSDWDNYCKQQGITYKMSLSYISEQNSRAERFNKTVMRSVRSILYKKKLSKSCWGKITCRVIYTLNWTLFRDDFKSAFKYLQGKKSHLSHLKILECCAWVHILKET